MLAGIQNAVAGLQASDLQMDLPGTRLTSDIAVPFPQVLDSAAASTTLPLNIPIPQGDAGNTAVPSPATDNGTPPLPGLLPADTVSALGAGDPALDMGLYLIAKAAFQMNARVVSAANHEWEELARLGQ